MKFGVVLGLVQWVPRSQLETARNSLLLFLWFSLLLESMFNFLILLWLLSGNLDFLLNFCFFWLLEFFCVVNAFLRARRSCEQFPSPEA